MLKSGVKRYHQSYEYQRDYRLEHNYDLCECGSRKQKHSKRCRVCSNKARTGRKIVGRVTPAEILPKTEVSRRYRLWTQIKDRFSPYCPYCQDEELHKREWRGTAYYRCGGCGLEITPMEIRRIQVWEAA